MEKIDLTIAMAKMRNYVQKLENAGQLNHEKDDFTIVFPLENHQAVIITTEADEEGFIQVLVSKNTFIINKLEDTVLDLFEEDQD